MTPNQPQEPFIQSFGHLFITQEPEVYGGFPVKHLPAMYAEGYYRSNVVKPKQRGRESDK